MPHGELLIYAKFQLFFLEQFWRKWSPILFPLLQSGCHTMCTMMSELAIKYYPWGVPLVLKVSHLSFAALGLEDGPSVWHHGAWELAPDWLHRTTRRCHKNSQLQSPDRVMSDVRAFISAGAVISSPVLEVLQWVVLVIWIRKVWILLWIRQTI